MIDRSAKYIYIVDKTSETIGYIHDIYLGSDEVMIDIIADKVHNSAEWFKPSPEDKARYPESYIIAVKLTKCISYKAYTDYEQFFTDFFTVIM